MLPACVQKQNADHTRNNLHALPKRGFYGDKRVRDLQNELLFHSHLPFHKTQPQIRGDGIELKDCY